MDCCVKKFCWVFVTQGLCTIGSDELVFIIECYDQNDEKIPKQMFVHIMDIFSRALKGQRFNSMSYSLYQVNSSNTSNNEDKNVCFLDNKNNTGFLYFEPLKYNCLKNISYLLPDESYMFAILIQKSEIPWAKLFPLRLLLMLGAEYKCYPYPIVSSRSRKALCGDIGHTIMNLLCDLRNYQYSITQIDGLYIKIEQNLTFIQIPQSQYDSVMKSILTSNDYVLSMASLNINDTCTSHLVAVENDNATSYISRKISSRNDNIDSTSNDSTGAAFVVFNGSLKSSLNSTINAKLTIVEDGLMIQIDTDTMDKLKQALQAMKPFRIECNKPSTLNSPPVQENALNEVIMIEWYKTDRYINKNVYSPIDLKHMCGVKSIRLPNFYDFMSETKLIRLTEIFLIKIAEDTNSPVDSNFNVNRFVDSCSQAFCLALIMLLDDLVTETIILINLNNNKSTAESKRKKPCDEASFFKLALRITVNRDTVEYQMGSNGIQITDEKYLSNLDNEMIPILHQANAYNVDICLEFVFYVLDRYNIEAINNNSSSNGNKNYTSSSSSSSTSSNINDS